MKPNWLPIGIGVGPPLVVHACHAISASAGLMPFCVPYLQGCVSMSAAARNPPANYLFDALMIPAAVLLILFWSRTSHWLAIIAPGIGARIVVLFGIVGGCFMIVYAVFLGAEEDYSRVLRRIGINGYILFTVLAQISLTVRLRQIGPQRVLILICAAELLMGAFSVIEDLAEWHNNSIDNIIEWNFALFMSLYFVAIARQWGMKPGSSTH